VSWSHIPLARYLREPFIVVSLPSSFISCCQFAQTLEFTQTDFAPASKYTLNVNVLVHTSTDSINYVSRGIKDKSGTLELSNIIYNVGVAAAGLGSDTLVRADRERSLAYVFVSVLPPRKVFLIHLSLTPGSVSVSYYISGCVDACARSCACMWLRHV